MNSVVIQPFMFQAHPAYRTQIDVLRAGCDAIVLPVLPDDRVEHERWRTTGGLFERALNHLSLSIRQRTLLAAADEARVHISGAFPPHMHRLLNRVKRAHIDSDDPLTLFTGGARGYLPGNKFRSWALTVCRRLGPVSQSFWSRIQMASFLGNLHAAETQEFVESGLISVLPPAIFPRVEKSTVGSGGALRCLSIASGKFWHKGIPDTIVAVDRLAQSGLPITLSLIGAAIPAEWRTFIGSRPYLFLHEKLSRANLDFLFLEHDLLVFPSHHDTYGWVLLEAKSFGLPALATDCYSRPEIIAHGQDGLLVRDPFSNPFLPIHPVPYAASHISIVGGSRLRVGPLLEPYIEELTEAMRRLVDEASLLRQLGTGALASVQPYAAFGAAGRAERLARHLCQ